MSAFHTQFQWGCCCCCCFHKDHCEPWYCHCAVSGAVCSLVSVHVAPPSAWTPAQLSTLDRAACPKAQGSKACFFFIFLGPGLRESHHVFPSWVLAFSMLLGDYDIIHPPLPPLYPVPFLSSSQTALLMLLFHRECNICFCEFGLFYLMWWSPVPSIFFQMT